MGKKQKFYVVWQGRETGIFRSWSACEKQVKGFEAARFKSYDTEPEAIKAFAAGTPAFKKASVTVMKNSDPGHVPIMDSISVDAACSGNPGVMEYRGVVTSTGKQLFKQGPFPEGTVNIGEFLAIVHGLGYLKQRNLDIPVYTDSKTALKWLKDKKANTKLLPNETNEALMILLGRAEAWLHAHQWNNPVLKWDTKAWGEIPADFGRK
ncbi:MAG: ribonuclease H family protein [Lentimicrobium sp.]|nr:ribonuclease H family protein [Lentimicrobium sp.]